MLLTFGLLGAAIFAVWLPNVPMRDGWRMPAWQPLFIAAAVAGLASGILRWPASLALGAVWAAAWMSARPARPGLRGAWLFVTALMAFGLAVHLFPGFAATIVAADVRLSADSAAMTLKADFDNGAAGLVLLFYCCRRVCKLAELPSVLATGIVVGAVTAGVAIVLVAGFGAIHFDPKLPAITVSWLAVNLMLTCLIEEAFFRGIVQDRLARAVVDRPGLRHVPIAVASVLFGLAHFGGGPLLILAATVAGVGYGVAYARTCRIEAAVLAHFVLNTIHFLGFTYPYAAR